MLRDRMAVAAIVALLTAGCSFDLPATGDGGTDGPDIDAPVLPTVEFAQASMTQDETSGLLMVEVTLAAGATGQVTVPFTFSGTAMINDDYLATPGTLTFALDETSKLIPVTIVADQEAEGPETIVITLGAPTGAMLGSTSTHAIEIAANTLPRVNLSTATSMLDEGTAVTITLSLDKAANGPATVNYTVAGVTAQGSGTFADYTLGSGVVTFPVGSTMETLPLGVINDLRNEIDETLTITLTTSTGVVIGTTAPMQTHTILNNDPVPSVSFTQATSTVTEGDSGSAPVTLSVTLSAASGRIVTVPYMINAAATSMTVPGDYMLIGTSVTFDEGELTKNITVNVVGDVVNEPTEMLTLVLGAPADGSATVANGTHQLTVTDNDPACVGAQPFRVCYNSAPAGAVVLPASIDTATSGLCESNQPQQWTGMQNQPTVCVIRGTSISNSGTTTVTGSRPLVLAATGDITIATLDVSSRRGGTLGPGATTQLSTCSTFVQVPGSGGGGAGGSFLTLGGDGGLGLLGAAAGRAANQVTAPSVLRAGCHGQQGNGGDEIGKGGGVVYIAAGGMLTITGGIDAGGSGAIGGPFLSGGSGGGSGGMIVLQATTIVATGAEVIANGAGGASGGDQNSTGRDGEDPDLATPTTPAPGGSGAATGGAGGNGWAGMTAATDGAGTGAAMEGGGGGGGGGGYIRSNVAITGATVSAGSIQIIP